MKEKEPTEQEMHDYFNKLKSKLMQDPKWELRQELGKFLLRHIDDLSEQEKTRYDELLILLKEAPTPSPH